MTYEITKVNNDPTCERYLLYRNNECYKIELDHLINVMDKEQKDDFYSDDLDHFTGIDLTEDQIDEIKREWAI
jgi:hypothetical protein